MLLNIFFILHSQALTKMHAHRGRRLRGTNFNGGIPINKNFSLSHARDINREHAVFSRVSCCWWQNNDFRGIQRCQDLYGDGFKGSNWQGINQQSGQHVSVYVRVCVCGGGGGGGGMLVVDTQPHMSTCG